MYNYEHVLIIIFKVSQANCKLNLHEMTYYRCNKTQPTQVFFPNSGPGGKPRTSLRLIQIEKQRFGHPAHFVVYMVNEISKRDITKFNCIYMFIMC